MATAPEKFYLPDTLRYWPWPRALNEHYAQCKAESSAWCEAHQAFSPKAQRAFNLCDFNLLASLAYAGLPKDVNRVGCDLMNLFFVYDEHSDAMDADSVRVWAGIIMDALRNPLKPRPKGEPVVGEVTRTFWVNAMKCLGPTAQKRFIDTFDIYTESVVQQAEDRDDHVFRDVDSYMQVRRDTIGAKPSFALLEHDMELPDEVFNHPLMYDLRMWCIDMLCLGNDICSYNVEQSRGDDGHNIVKLVMLQEKTDIHGAMKYISDMHDRLADSFLENYKKLPSWGQPIDAWVARYVDGLGNWVRANDTWSFESWRYFKEEGLRIQTERWVELLPPVDAEELTSSIPPESRWIRPVVVPNRPRPQNVGIVALEVYLPKQLVGLGSIPHGYIGNLPTTKSQRGIAIADSHEDPRTIAFKTVSSLIEKFAIDPRSIGRLDIASETPNENVKQHLMQLFSAVENTDVEGSTSVTLSSALRNALNWIESSSWDGRYAIVFVGDVLPSGQANVVGTHCAMLVGPNAPIVVEPSHGTYVEIKPNSSSYAYATAIEQAYTDFRNKSPSAKKGGNAHENPASLTDLDLMIFQSRPDEVVRSAYTKLLMSENTTVSDMGSSFQKAVEPSMVLAKSLGNLGIGSVLGSLVSVLTSVSAEELHGKRIGVFAIGRGTTVFFSLRIAGNTGMISRRLDLERRLDGIKIVPLAKPPVSAEVVQVSNKAAPVAVPPSVGTLALVWQFIISGMRIFRLVW